MTRFAKNGPVILLECTLRDGSYSIDYQFSADDTENIARALANAGFQLIEVGHGLGFSAGLKGFGESRETDIEYILAGVRGVANTGAMIGYFFIPGIGELKDLDEAVTAGLGFVRVGTNITEFENAEESVKYAKSLNLFVSVNLMKSYAVSADRFADVCEEVAQYGADTISLVDSAGGMLPEEIAEYTRKALDKIDIPLGFHGHNNFQLAIANCLAARSAGARILDTSIRGMGRSAGNAQTEILVALLDKIGDPTGIDLLRTMDIGEKLIAPLMPSSKGIDDIALATGLGKFHSSFLPKVKKAADSMGVDLRELIVRLGDVDIVSPDEELIMDLAQDIAKRPRRLTFPSAVKFEDENEAK